MGLIPDPHAGTKHVKGAKVKVFVFPERPAETPRELISKENRRAFIQIPVGVLEDIAGIQMRVRVEPAQRSVIFVGAALGDHVNDRCRVAPVFRRKTIGLDSDLLNGVGIGRQIRDASARIAVGCGAVHGEIVRLRPLAVGIQVDAVFRVEDVRRRLRVSLSAAAGQACYAGCQHHQAEHIAPHERKFVDFGLVDLAGNGARSQSHRSRRDGHFNLLAGRAEFQVHIDCAHFGHLNPDLAQRGRFKPRGARGEGEDAGRQSREAIISCRHRHRVVLDAGADFVERYRGVGNHGAAGVENCTF